MTGWQDFAPADIERRSFEIITEHIGNTPIIEEQRPILLRVIHTTADFDYVQNLHFSATAVQAGLAALRQGASVLTDTNMAAAGINKAALSRLGGKAYCFMADVEVAEEAAARGITRAAVCMEKAVNLLAPLIVAVGNAPTALLRLVELIEQGSVQPALIIGVPVGFVNVAESKQLVKGTGIPYIVSDGLKGGSNVAAAIVNALMYEAVNLCEK